MKNLHCIAPILVLLAAPVLASAATIHVPADYANIRTAVTAAATGDSVVVDAGTYIGTNDRNIDFGGKSLHLVAPAGSMLTVIDCDYSGFGIRIQNAVGPCTIDGFTIQFASGNSGAGIIIQNSSGVTVRNCLISGCTASFNGGGIFIGYTTGPTVVEDCRIVTNSGMYRAGGIMIDHAAETTVRRTLLAGNHTIDPANGGAAIFDNSSSLVSVTYCTFIDNANRDGLDSYSGQAVMFDLNTTVSNSLFYLNGDLATQRLFWGNGFDYSKITCCDIFGPTDPAEIAALIGTGDNISSDPLFCNASGPNSYGLADDSPCLNGPCGQIGAYGATCPGYLPDGVPLISSITDVGNDQGRQVRLTFSASRNAPTAVDQYVVFRRIAAAKTIAPGGYWDFVAVVPEVGLPEYNVVVPTLCDSTISGGLCESSFFVRAATANPAVSYDSPPQSGYSVDNLAPAAPTGLLLAAGGLTWDDPQDADFDYFTVFGSDTGALDPGAVVVGHTIGTTLDVSTARYGYYLVAATDFAGNQGPVAVVSSGLSDVPGGMAVRTALLGNHPNPFNPSTVIAYTLADAERVDLCICDVSGRIVRRLRAGVSETGGHHEVTWDGRDDAGRRVASGTYLYRLKAGGFTESKRMVLVK